jgi:CubicO group peptidase (beta-lactamase class C family)
VVLGSLSIASATALQSRTATAQQASPTTFGHGGKESSTGFVDPDKNLVVSLIFNGMPGEPKHDRRQKRVLAALYEALES